MNENYGACGLCSETVTNEGALIEPFGNCCVNCVQDIKEFGTSRTLLDEEAN